MAKITCSMCGHVFEPGDNSTCACCPLQKGCQLVRCPACGFEVINPQQSVLARLVMKYIDRTQTRKTKKAEERLS